MKLYHIPGSRSCRVRGLLEELELDYELVSFQLLDRELTSPEYLAKNPMGRVPTLEDKGVTFFESGAILEYILERYGEGRLRPDTTSDLWPIYLQWFHWGEAALMPPMAVIMGNRFVLKEEDRSERALNVARRQLANLLKVLGAAVAGRKYLVGDDLTAADIVTAYSLQLLKSVGELPDSPASVHEWHSKLSARPAFVRAFEGGFGG